MRLLMTGVGGAFTTRHFNTGALIESDEGFILLDCGGMILRALAEATAKAGWSAAPSDIHDIILTHLHGDHCNGLEQFGFLRRLHRRENPDLPLPRLHTSPQAAPRVWERLAPAMDRPFFTDQPSTLADFYDLNILRPDEPNEVCGITVETKLTGHPLPTIALRLQDSRGCVGWSSDATFDQELVEWLSEGDVIIHETNLGPAHAPIEELNALPDDIRRKMLLMHYPDDMTPESTDMRMLVEGNVVEVNAG